MAAFSRKRLANTIQRKFPLLSVVLGLSGYIVYRGVASLGFVLIS